MAATLWNTADRQSILNRLSAPTAPELIDRIPVSWAAELDTLRATVDRFIARDVSGPWPPHVAFGRISGSQWGRLTHRHLDHHLGQFGV